MTKKEISAVEYAAVGAREAEILEAMLRTTNTGGSLAAYSLMAKLATLCNLVESEGEFYRKYFEYKKKNNC